jgi:DNA-binding MarR family transcriptional regulator
MLQARGKPMRAERRSVRQRSSCYARILAAIDAFRGVREDATIADLIVFLSVCEREGILIGDVAEQSGFSDSMVSRSIAGMATPSQHEGHAATADDLDRELLLVAKHPSDGRRRLLFLTDEGQEIRRTIERRIYGVGRPRRSGPLRRVRTIQPDLSQS